LHTEPASVVFYALHHYPERQGVIPELVVPCAWTDM
jgi:hypothetical protein